MKALTSEPRIFQFRFPKLGAFLKVEVWDDSVIIRSTRNTFSALRKAAFVRELVAEGFIPEDFLWASIAGDETPNGGIQWLVEKPGFKQDEAMAERTRRTVLRLTAPVGLMLAIFIGLASPVSQRSMTGPHERIGGRGQHYTSSSD
jgi:hypothetical protein